MQWSVVSVQSVQGLNHSLRVDPVRAAGDWLCLSSSLVHVLSLRDTQRPSRPMVGSNVASGKEPSCQAGLARRKREPTHVEAIERTGSILHSATGTPASKRTSLQRFVISAIELELSTYEFSGEIVHIWRLRRSRCRPRVHTQAVQTCQYLGSSHTSLKRERAQSSLRESQPVFPLPACTGGVRSLQLWTCPRASRLPSSKDHEIERYTPRSTLRLQ